MIISGFYGYVLIKIPDYRNSIIVARNSGQAKRATAIAERLGLSIGVIHGADDKDAQTDGENSTQPPPASLKRNSRLFRRFYHIRFLRGILYC